MVRCEVELHRDHTRIPLFQRVDVGVLALIGVVDFAGLAESMGVTGVGVQTLTEFTTAFEAAMDREGPTLLDIDMRKLIPMQGSILPAQ